jgi:hypothetical protein
MSACLVKLSQSGSVLARGIRLEVTTGSPWSLQVVRSPRSVRAAGHSAKGTINGGEVTCARAHAVMVRIGGTTVGINVVCGLV